jgi:hypothetical protein
MSLGTAGDENRTTGSQPMGLQQAEQVADDEKSE